MEMENGEANLGDKLKVRLMSEEEEEEKDSYPQTWALTFTANLMLERDISEDSATSEFPPNSLSDPF